MALRHRVFIQEAWSAMENAALPPKTTKMGEHTVGVFAAAGIDGGGAESGEL